MRPVAFVFLSASSFCLLHASSVHSGYTWLVNTRFLPSREKMTPSASVERLVTCLGLEPSVFIIQICDEPPRSETKAILFESGDQRARSLLSPASVMRRGVPPASGTT